MEQNRAPVVCVHEHHIKMTPYSPRQPRAVQSFWRRDEYQCENEGGTKRCKQYSEKQTISHPFFTYHIHLEEGGLYDLDVLPAMKNSQGKHVWRVSSVKLRENMTSNRHTGTKHLPKQQ